MVVRDGSERGVYCGRDELLKLIEEEETLILNLSIHKK